MAGTVYTTVTYESIMSGQQIFWIYISGIAAVAAIALVPLIGLFWRAIIRDVVRETRLIALKAEMVRAEFSAGDIERVIRAVPGVPRRGADGAS